MMSHTHTIKIQRTHHLFRCRHFKTSQNFADKNLNTASPTIALWQLFTLRQFVHILEAGLWRFVTPRLSSALIGYRERERHRALAHCQLLRLSSMENINELIISLSSAVLIYWQAHFYSWFVYDREKVIRSNRLLFWVLSFDCINDSDI